jgi:ribonuclease P protein component
VAGLDMLRSPLDFRAIQSGSRSRAHPLLILRYRRNELDRTRYGISTSRRIGPAVVRNRLRRRLRTVLRRLDPAIERGWDLLLIARADSGSATQAQMSAAVERLLAAAGLTVERPPEPGAGR